MFNLALSVLNNQCYFFFFQIKKKILAEPSQITRKLKGKDPRENYVQLEARPGGILEKARRDPKDLSLTLEKHVPFWRDGPGHRDGGLVPMPDIGKHFIYYLIFKNFIIIRQKH